MALEEGAKVSGTVSGITNFGAFIDLEDNKTGLVHISQVSDRFVKDIHDVLAVGDQVMVKVVRIGEDGKIALSMKQAAPATAPSHGHHEASSRSHHDRAGAPMATPAAGVLVATGAASITTKRMGTLTTCSLPTSRRARPGYQA